MTSTTIDVIPPRGTEVWIGFEAIGHVVPPWQRYAAIATPSECNLPKTILERKPCQAKPLRSERGEHVQGRAILTRASKAMP